MTVNQPTIIITGAAGFIGSALAWRLNERGRNRLLLVDHLAETEKWKNLVPLAYQDYMEKSVFLADLEAGRLDGMEVEAVFHFGACSATTEIDASYLIRNNFDYSKTLARWCLERPKPIRFIYASSAATYGSGEQGYRDDHTVLSTLRPLNAYGFSKFIFDSWCQKQGYLDQVVGLKFFNVYGPNEYHKGEMRSMVVKAFEQIRNAGRVDLFKSHRKDYQDGEQLRDFIYVKDAVDMALFFLGGATAGETAHAGGSTSSGIFNIGTGVARTWVDLAQALFRSMGRDPKIEFVPMPEGMRGKYQYFTRADISKLRAVGYSAKISTLEEGVADFLPYLEKGPLPLGWA